MILMLFFLIFTGTPVQTVQTSPSENLSTATYIHQSISSYTTPRDQAYAIVKYIKKQKTSLQVSLYHNTFAWCFNHNKRDLLAACIEMTAPRFFIQKLSDGHTLGYWILKETIFKQDVLLLQSIMRKIPTISLKQYLSFKDIHEKTLYDYARITNNQEVIDSLNISAYTNAIFSQVLGILATIITVVLIIPIALWVIPCLLLIPAETAGGGDIVVFGLFYYFPVLLLTSIVTCTYPVMSLFGLKESFVS